MNPGSAEQVLDSVLNVEIEYWMQQFYPAQTNPPDPGRSRSTVNEQLEIELVNIINTTNKRSHMIAAPAIGSGVIGSCDFAAGAISELEMRRIAASLRNSAEATSVTTRAIPRSSYGRINNYVSAAENTSAFHRSSSTLATDPAAVPARVLCRGAGAVKVKKKRVRPSRRVHTTVVKTDTSNFKAMVQHFTGISTTTTSTQDSTTAPSVCTSRESGSSASSDSFSKSLPRSALCKILSSVALAANTGTTCPSPLLPYSLPTGQSLPDLRYISTTASMTDSDHIRSATMSPIDAALFEKLWS